MSGAQGNVSTFRLAERLAIAKPVLRLTNPHSQQLVFVHSGVGSVSLNGRHFTLRAGSAVVVPASTACVFRFETRSDGLCLRIRESYWRSQIIPALAGSCQGADRLRRAFHAPALVNELADEADRGRRDDVMRELLAASRRVGFGCDPAVVAYMLIVMYEPHLRAATSEASTGRAGPQPTTPGLVLKFRDLIEHHFVRHLRLRDYCRLLRVSQRRLSAECQTATGLKPLTLIQERIILEAKRQLCSSYKPIAEIGASLGFRDLSYFSRFIKRRTGMSPKSFRRQEARAPGTTSGGWPSIVAPTE
jgi:AraC family transcriptional activator of pobA